MSSDSSDIELQSALPKNSNKKMPQSPSEDILKKKQEKKHTTKMMINQALIDLKSRKGVSLYAIKKYIKEKFNVDTEKMSYIIKKSLKTAVEDGTIVQTKGIGATGSFKLVPVKEKKLKPKKIAKEKKEKSKDPEKKKNSKDKTKKKSTEKSVKSKTKPKDNKESREKPEKPKKTMVKEKVTKEKVTKEKKEKKNAEEKVKKVRIAKGMQTPAKKKNMMKRKSIGSIIKPPKMKPGKA